MRRPWSIKLLSACLFGLALFAVVSVFGVLSATSSKDILAEADASKVIMVLRMVALSMAVFALFEVLLAVGLWRRSLRAWWTSIVLQSISILIFAYEAISSSSRDSEDILLAVVPMGLLALHFLPGVRRWVRPVPVAVISNP